MNPNDIYVLQTDFDLLPYGNEIAIARYFSKEKVKLLIEKPGIWFSRFDRMSDESEGEYHALFKRRKQGFSLEQLSLMQDAKRATHMPLVSCWTVHDGRDRKYMWEEFGAAAAGICCVSTPSMLRNSLEVTDIPCGFVLYFSDEELNSIDESIHPIRPVFYSKDSIEMSTYPSNEFVKRDCFSEEKEVRFICFANDFVSDKDNKAGCLVGFEDLSNEPPFSEIIVSPGVDCATEIALRNTFRCPVVSSEVLR